jgi:pimeloyl-ACP methyl ester carboxylesterase
VAGTLVLLHAFPLSAEMWRPQLALADLGWRIIAPPLGAMGQGSAARDAITKTVDDYAGEVIDLLDSLHLENVVLGGLSMGGYVAFAMMRLAPRYLSGLILADTRPQADTPEGRQGREKMLSLLNQRGVGAVAEEMLPKLLGDTTRRERPAVADQVRQLAASNSVDAVAGAIHALMTRPDSTPLMKEIHVPALIVVGEEDGITPQADSEQMQRSIGGSELVVIPRAGHLSNIEDPAAFNMALGHFLAHRV